MSNQEKIQEWQGLKVHLLNLAYSASIQGNEKLEKEYSNQARLCDKSIKMLESIQKNEKIFSQLVKSI